VIIPVRVVRFSRPAPPGSRPRRPVVFDPRRLVTRRQAQRRLLAKVFPRAFPATLPLLRVVRPEPRRPRPRPAP